MNIIDRESFLDDLQMVKPGLSRKEMLEQSSCFVFRKGCVLTFNDEIACMKKTQLNAEGAVSADSLISILEKLPDDKLEAEVNSDQGTIIFRGKKKRFWTLLDPNIILPVEKIEEEIPTKWKQLPKNFSEVISAVKNCVGRDDNQWALTCIHLHPEWIEACDGKQVLRWRSSIGLKRPLLVRGEALSQIVGLGIFEVGSSENWLHFRNKKGLIFSCRKFHEEYHDLSSVISVKGEAIKFPKALLDVAGRAAVFAAEQTAGIDTTVKVSLKPNKITVTGEGLIGGYEEFTMKGVSYSGPKMSFMLPPALLQHIVTNYTECEVAPKKLRASGGVEGKDGRWDYVTVLGSVKKAGEEPEKDETPAQDEE